MMKSSLGFLLGIYAADELQGRGFFSSYKMMQLISVCAGIFVNESEPEHTELMGAMFDISRSESSACWEMPTALSAGSSEMFCFNV